MTTSRGGVGGGPWRVAATAEGNGWAVVDSLTFAGVKEGKFASKEDESWMNYIWKNLPRCSPQGADGGRLAAAVDCSCGAGCKCPQVLKELRGGILVVQRQRPRKFCPGHHQEYW